MNALLAAIGVATPEEMIAFLRAHKDALPGLHVAFKAPPLPEYYQPDEGASQMDVSVVIDRGDIWYDFPFDTRGKPIVQRRDHYPHLTMFVDWHGQKIPLCQMADDDRLVAQRGARGRQGLLQVQELRHRAARLEDDRRRRRSGSRPTARPPRTC